MRKKIQNTFSYFFNPLRMWIRNNPTTAARIVKTLFVVGFVWILYYEVFQRKHANEIFLMFQTQLLRGWQWYWLVLMLLLLPINWAAETMKWLPLMRHIEQMSFLKAYKAVLAGVTFSLFTPNRMGEYGGRVLFVQPENAIKAVFANIVGSLVQQYVMLTFGFFGFMYFVKNFWELEAIAWNALLYTGILVIIIFFFMFIYLENFINIFGKIGFLRRQKWIVKNIKIVREFSRQEIYIVFFWSIVRYLTYCTQYYFLLRFFGINVDVVRGAACIATVYYLQGAVPLPPAVSLLARGEIALKVWGMFHENEIAILATTFVLWIINVVLPAFLGLILIVNSNVSNVWFAGLTKKWKRQKKVVHPHHKHTPNNVLSTNNQRPKTESTKHSDNEKIKPQL